jgi:hypothetical protein
MSFKDLLKKYKPKGFKIDPELFNYTKKKPVKFKFNVDLINYNYDQEYYKKRLMKRYGKLDDQLINIYTLKMFVKNQHKKVMSELLRQNKK